MKTLTADEIKKVQATLAHARRGTATLSQLAEAHDLANGADLNGCIGELRAHMRSMVPAPPLRGEFKDMILGIVTGILTHLLLRDVDRRHKTE